MEEERSFTISITHDDCTIEYNGCDYATVLGCMELVKMRIYDNIKDSKDGKEKNTKES